MGWKHHGPSGFAGHHPDVPCQKGGDLQEGTAKQLGAVHLQHWDCFSPLWKTMSKKFNRSFDLYFHLIIKNTLSHINKLFLCFFISFKRPVLDSTLVKIILLLQWPKHLLPINVWSWAYNKDFEFRPLCCYPHLTFTYLIVQQCGLNDVSSSKLEKMTMDLLFNHYHFLRVHGTGIPWL